MKRTILVLVSADPRKSGRPAEAVRVAAGLSGHERLAVTLCLCGQAEKMLGSDAEELVDGDGLAEFLGVLKESGGRVLVERGGSDASEAGASGAGAVIRAELDRLIAGSERVLRF